LYRSTGRLRDVASGNPVEMGRRRRMPSKNFTFAVRQESGDFHRVSIAMM
jgi:hypothetical protein